MKNYGLVCRFWFDEIRPEQWWSKDPAFDALIRHRFLRLHQKAVSGELDEWRNDPEGALAEIIILDQFSRNMFRGRAESFAFDAQALSLAQAAIRLTYDMKIPGYQRAFMYLPFMHSESIEIQKISVKLYENLGQKENLIYAIKHKIIIDRFGRYPHRNALLNRQSTAEEVQFLQEEGSSF